MIRDATVICDELYETISVPQLLLQEEIMVQGASRQEKKETQTMRSAWEQS